MIQVNALWYRSIIIALIVLGGCKPLFFRSPPTVHSIPTVAELKRIGQIMKITFPKNTTPIMCWRNSVYSDSIYLKIEIAPSSLKELMDKSPFSDVKMSDSVQPLPAPKEAKNWWNVRTIKKGKYASNDISKRETVSIIIDEDNSETVIVYLRWLEM
jgi:hypothetical protein